MADPVEGHGGWGNLRLSRRDRLAGTAEDAAEARFRMGLGVFLAVALLYPWYEYWVQTRLLARDVTQAAEEVGKALERETAAMERKAAARAEQPRQATRRRHDASIRTMGAMRTRSGPMVIVDLGGRSLQDARLPICVQAAQWLGEPVDGQTLRVQRYRVNRPSVGAGEVRC